MILELCAVVLICAIVFQMLNTRPSGLPPGDWGYPIIGSLPKGRKELDILIEEQSKKYGNIFSAKIGSTIVIFLTDFHLMKNAFSKLELSGRPQTFSNLAFTYNTGYGIAFNNGHIFQENRRFALKTLSYFGMGKSRIQEIIQIEVADLLENISARANKITTVGWPLNAAVLNIIWQLSASKRFELDDVQVQILFDKLLNIYTAMGGQLSFLDFLPLADKLLPKFLKKLVTDVDIVYDELNYFKDHFQVMIDEHIKTFDRNCIRDYIDAYLLDLEKGVEEKNEYKRNLLNLNATLLNFFVGGSETTVSTIRWLLLYMCIYPEIQERIQKEIDSVVDRDRPPTLEDRDRLAYVEAVVYEVSRITSLVPQGVFHMATEDTELAGYKIPKGALICSCIDKCHMNPDYFDNPTEFHPERFLDSNGKLLDKKEGYVPFSIGRRLCPGEALAKMELYLFTTGILQRFKVSFPEGQTTYDLEPVRLSFFNYAPPYNLIFTKR